MRDDEGCQGNPPCQPASAYFSPLALSRSIQHPPVSSRTKRNPAVPAAARRAPPCFPRTLAPRLLLLTCLSTCALPSTVTNQPPPPFHASPPLRLAPSPPRHLAIPFYTFIFGRVFLHVALSLSLPCFTSPPPRRICLENLVLCNVVYSGDAATFVYVRIIAPIRHNVRHKPFGRSPAVRKTMADKICLLDITTKKKK